MGKRRHPVGEDAIGLRTGPANVTDSLNIRKQRTVIVPLINHDFVRRYHPPMTVFVETVDVTPVIQHRCHGRRMDTANMIDLGVRLHGNFPVTLQIEGLVRYQPAVIELELRQLISHRTQPVQQTGRRIIKIDKDQVTKHFCTNGFQSAAAKVKIAKVLRIPDTDEITLQVIAPAMIDAGQTDFFALPLSDNRRTSMLAGVVKGIDLTRLVMDDHQGFAGIIPEHEGAWLRHLVNVSDEQPGFSPQVLLLQLVKSLVGISPCWQVR